MRNIEQENKRKEIVALIQEVRDEFESYKTHKRWLHGRKSVLSLVKQLKQNFETASERLEEVNSASQEALEMSTEFADRTINALALLRPQLTEARANLAYFRKKVHLTKKDIRQAQSSLEDARESYNRHLKKHKKARKWGWVPGYGTYISIRTLTDHDLEHMSDLSDEIHLLKYRLTGDRRDLHKADHHMELVESRMLALGARITTYNRALEDTRKDLKAIRKLIVEVHRHSMWIHKALLAVGQVNVQQQEISELLEELGTERNSPDWDDLIQEEYISTDRAMERVMQAVVDNESILYSPKKLKGSRWTPEEVEEEVEEMIRRLTNFTGVWRDSNGNEIDIQDSHGRITMKPITSAWWICAKGSWTFGEGNGEDFKPLFQGKMKFKSNGNAKETLGFRVIASGKELMFDNGVSYEYHDNNKVKNGSTINTLEVAELRRIYR